MHQPGIRAYGDLSALQNAHRLAQRSLSHPISELRRTEGPRLFGKNNIIASAQKDNFQTVSLLNRRRAPGGSRGKPLLALPTAADKKHRIAAPDIPQHLLD